MRTSSGTHNERKDNSWPGCDTGNRLALSGCRVRMLWCSIGGYPQPCVAWTAISHSASRCRGDSRFRGVPVSSVPRETLLRGVRVSGVGQLCGVGLRGVDVSGVGRLRSLRASGVEPSSSVRVSGVQQLRGVRSRSALAFALPDVRLHQSPREVLRATMHELRRAAEAKRFLRIARRLAGLARGRTERVLWSSRKSLRGVC